MDDGDDQRKIQEKVVITAAGPGFHHDDMRSGDTLVGYQKSTCWDADGALRRRRLIFLTVN